VAEVRQRFLTSALLDGGAAVDFRAKLRDWLLSNETRMNVVAPVLLRDAPELVSGDMVLGLFEHFRIKNRPLLDCLRKHSEGLEVDVDAVPNKVILAGAVYQMGWAGDRFEAFLRGERPPFRLVLEWTRRGFTLELCCPDFKPVAELDVSEDDIVGLHRRGFSFEFINRGGRGDVSPELRSLLFQSQAWRSAA
jgi:hypothetical protein